MGFWTPWNPTGADVPMPWDTPAYSPPNTRPQGGTTPGGTQLGAQQRPTTGAGYYPGNTYSIPTPNYNPPSGGGQQQPQQQQAQQTDYSLQIAQMNAELQRQQMAQQAQQAAAQLAWQREQQQAELEADKQQRLATLASQPKSWLEYASLSGKAPVVQPWMLPLMKGDYGITSAGSPIPNWSATDMTNMPDLIPPSAQYMARIGPTSQQQLYGYEQAVHGATPDESQWRQWSMAPPGSGSYRGLQMQR